MLKTKRKKLFINIVFLLFVLFICFLVLEFTLRILFPLEYISETEHILSDYGVFVRAPHNTFTIERTEFSQEIVINSKGLRDKEYTYEKEKDVYRIIMVGDSFVDAYQVALEETIPKKLEQQLNTEQTKTYEVINFGYEGYGLVPEAVLIKEEVLKYDPDMIILNYFAGNDLDKISIGAYKQFPDVYWDKEQHDETKQHIYGNDLKLKLKSFLRRNFMTYYIFKRIFVNSSSKQSQTKEPLNSIYKKEYTPYLQKNLATTELIFTFLDELTKEKNIKLAVFLIPTREQMDKETFYAPLKDDPTLLQKYSLDQPQKVIKNLLAKKNIFHRDLLLTLQEKNKQTSLYFEQDGHFNKEGYAFVTQEIYKTLIKSGLLVDSNE